MKEKASVSFTVVWMKDVFNCQAITDKQISYRMSTEQIMFLLTSVNLEPDGYI
jgi:hypothetical protein